MTRAASTSRPRASRKAAAPAGGGGRLRAVVGSDEAEVKRIALQYSVEMAPPGAGDLGVDVIDGVADNADGAATRLHQTIEAIQTLPFFGGEKLVWLKNANFLGDSVTGRAAAVVEATEKLAELLLAGLPPGVRFLLSATEIDKRRSFYKTLGKVAALEVFDKLDASRSGWEEAAADLVSRKARESGLLLRGEPLDLFVLLTGGETRQIANEIDKLDIYLGSDRREVTLEDIRLMVPPSRAGVVFELGNAIASRDLNQALGLVETLLFQGETAVAILLVAVIPTVRNLLLAKDLMERYRLSRPSAPFHFSGAINRLPPEATEHLPRKKDGTINSYSLGIAATGAHRYDSAELLAALEASLEANVRLVTSALDPRTLLTDLIVRIVAPAERAKTTQPTPRKRFTR